MNDRDPDQDILDEYERRRAEGTDLEGLTRVKATVSPNARSTFSIRLSKDEIGAISKAAKLRGVTLTDFIREVATSAAELELASQETETIDLVEMGQELDRLRKRIDAKLKSGANARAGA